MYVYWRIVVLFFSKNRFTQRDRAADVSETHWDLHAVCFSVHLKSCVNRSRPVSQQDVLQDGRMDVCSLQTLQESLHRGFLPFSSSPLQQSSQRRSVSAERVIGPAAKQRLRRQSQIQQHRLPLWTQPRRQPGQLPVRRNPEQHRVRRPPGVCRDQRETGGNTKYVLSWIINFSLLSKVLTSISKSRLSTENSCF